MNSKDDSTTGIALVQTSPNIRIACGEKFAKTGQLMSIGKSDGNAYLCEQNGFYNTPAGFLATDYPLTDSVIEKVYIIREGRIRGFSGLIPGTIYYPSCTMAGAISSNRTYEDNVPVGIAVSHDTL